MSNKHSLGAYRILLQARSSKTILVEGKDDKELFLKLRLSRAATNAFVIDSADILKDDELSGFGAKSRIDVLLNSIATESPAFKKIRCILDREWETLVDNELDSIAWSPPVCTVARHVTAGHSIENYSFVDSFVALYLNHFGGGVASPDLIAQISQAVPELVRYAAAFSEIARKQYVISRCSGLFEWSDIKWDGARVSTLPSLLHKMEARQVADADAMLNLIKANYETKWRSPAFSEDAHLHAHGHIGEDVLWCGIGSIVAAHGHSDAIVREVAHGRRDERKRVWHGWLVDQDDEYIAPLAQSFAS